MFKNRIGFWVKERGIKLKYISDQLGVSYQTVSNWINNRSQPDLKQSAQLARILSITVDQLINGEEDGE